MSEHHHHHLFHHKKEDENVPTQVVYSETVSDDGCQVTQTADVVAVQAKTEEDYRREEKHHKHKEHLGELGTIATGAFALHEKHKAEKDPENAHRHKVEEEVAAAVAVGGVGYTFHEHHQKKEAKEEAKEHRHHLLKTYPLSVSLVMVMMMPSHGSSPFSLLCANNFIHRLLNLRISRLYGLVMYLPT